MYRYFFSLLLLLFPLVLFAQADTSRENGTTTVKPDQKQLRFGIDISRPLLQVFYKNRRPGLEVIVDYNLPKDIYGVVEAGFGGSDINYEDLKYTSSNLFFKVGVDKSMLQRLYPQDWDFLFAGVRYGVGFINRSEASFTTTDNIWGTTTGTVPGKTFTGHWAELTGGLRVELFKGLFTGYTLKAKFLLNQKPFRELPPAYVAGYGKGEKNTVFDINFYLQYALRW